MTDELTLGSDRTLVVVGASLAGLRAVESARREGFEGKIVLIGEEPHLPYDRPPLSKGFISGQVADSTYHQLATFTDDLRVELILGSEATGLHVQRKEIITDTGVVPYDSLVLATGSTPRRIAGVPELSGIHLLRTKEHAKAIRESITRGKRVVVLGGGFIGAEVASSCRSLNADVTIIEAADVPLVRAVGTQMGATLSTLHERNGVCLRTGISVADVKGDSAVSAVELSDGTVLPTDVLVIGIGARPATDWLTDSGIALHRRDGGIICDRQLATSVAGVWAAGDVAWWDNETLGQQMRLENWTNASQQGTHAGRNAVRRDPTGFGTVPYYWTDWYQQRIQFVGIAPSDEVHLTGSVAESRFIAIYRTGSTITGALTLNQPGRIMKLRAMVAAGRSWDEAMAFVDRVGLA